MINTRQMKVVVFSPYYPPAYRAGGPVRSVSHLVRATPPAFSARVVSRNWDLGDRARLVTEANTWVAREQDTVWARDPGLRHYARALAGAARQRPGLVYLNSLFDPWMAIVPALVWRVLGARGSTLVVAPRGQLAPTALAKSAARKRVLVWFWRGITRHRRVVLHAATEQEKTDVERALGSVEVVVRANDVGPLLPAMPAPPAAGELRAVFLGRIVPIKGLLELLRSLRDHERPMSLDIYGPEEDLHYVDQCRRKRAICRTLCR